MSVEELFRYRTEAFAYISAYDKEEDLEINKLKFGQLAGINASQEVLNPNLNPPKKTKDDFFRKNSAINKHLLNCFVNGLKHVCVVFVVHIEIGFHFLKDLVNCLFHRLHSFISSFCLFLSKLAI